MRNFFKFYHYKLFLSDVIHDPDNPESDNLYSFLESDTINLMSCGFQHSAGIPVS